LGFLESIIQHDKELLVFLNGLGNENWDSFWLIITNQFSWIPLYIFFFFLIFKTFGWKKGLAFIVITSLMIAFSDQLTVFIKHTTERLRPCSDPTINIRDVLNRKSFSFVSGHATTSTAVTLLMHLTLRNYYKYTILFFIWPLLFAYSRIYVGVHFPGDVTIGALLGSLIGYIFYLISLRVLVKVDVKNSKIE
jgi:undecaprenyl-diphosphatase